MSFDTKMWTTDLTSNPILLLKLSIFKEQKILPQNFPQIIGFLPEGLRDASLDYVLAQATKLTALIV